MPAIGLCMHKILRIIYGMLKNNTSFDPAIDRKNQQRSVQNVNKSTKDTARRYQGFDSNAPISRRQRQKRKEQEESQNAAVSIKSGIIQPAP